VASELPQFSLVSTCHIDVRIYHDLEVIVRVVVSAESAFVVLGGGVDAVREIKLVENLWS